MQECARYLETFKQYEHRPPDSIHERVEGDYMSKLTNALTAVRGVNKTDVVTLGMRMCRLFLKNNSAAFSSCSFVSNSKVALLDVQFTTFLCTIPTVPHPVYAL